MQKITSFKKSIEKNTKKVHITVPFLDAPMLATDARFVYFFRNGNLKQSILGKIKFTGKNMAD